MKKTLWIILPVLLFCFVGVFSCKRINAGHTGILFNHYGIMDEKGISDRKVVSGTIWFNPLFRSVYEYPHFWQTVSYRDITFNSLEGEPIKSDLAVVYRLVRDGIPNTFDEYRLSPEDLAKTIIREVTLKALNDRAGQMGAVDIMGVKRELLLHHVLDTLNDRYSKNFEFQLVNFSSDLRPSDNVKSSVQAVIQAQEKAKTAAAKTLEIEEEAAQIIIRARADSLKVVSAAGSMAKEIELVQYQLNRSPGYIEYLRVTRWNGEFPQVLGGEAMNMISLK